MHDKSKRRVGGLVAGVVLGFGSIGGAHAADSFPAQGRIFIANSYVNPTEVNQVMTSQSLNTFDHTQQFGVEITYPVIKLLNVGIRYTRRDTTQNGTTPLISSAFHGTLKQDSILFLGRANLVRTGFFKFDAFAGIGGSNSSFELQSATQNGTFSKNAVDNLLGPPLLGAGTSVAFGFDKFFLYAEAGYERNQVDKLDRSGTLTVNVSSLALSGRYFMIGLMFDGVTATQR